jgi:hypothetical protein
MLAGGVEIIDSIGGDIADPDADEVSYDATPCGPAHDAHGGPATCAPA